MHFVFFVFFVFGAKPFAIVSSIVIGCTGVPCASKADQHGVAVHDQAAT